MKTPKFLIIAIALVAFTLTSACSFTTANLGDVKFGKNETATPPSTSFNTGEKIFAVAEVANAIGKYKVKFDLQYDNVAGKGKGESVGTQSIDIDGSSEVNFNFTANLPGDYKVVATLTDDAGKEIGKKSGTVNVKGSAPAAPAAAGDDDTDE